MEHATTNVASAGPNALGRETILIVEDEVLVAEDIRETLEEISYRVAGVARSADEAIGLARLHEPDLVLMDVSIDGPRDGVSTAMTLRRELDPAIVFLTSHSDETTLSRATTIAPNGYILKPFRTPDLVVAVRTGIANHRNRSGSLDDAELARASAPVKGGLSPHNLLRVEDFIDKRLGETITVAGLAELCGLSERHFAAQFKRSTSMSPGSFLIQRRVEEAKRMLSETDMKLADIAKTVGYPNMTYFATVFKRTVGLTPSEYRCA